MPLDGVGHILNAVKLGTLRHSPGKTYTPATASDLIMCQLMHAINAGFQNTHRLQYAASRDNLRLTHMGCILLYQLEREMQQLLSTYATWSEVPE